MSGNESQEKTEEPTEKKLRDAKDKGKIPRSKDFNTMAVMIAGAAGLWLQGGSMSADLQNMLRSGFSIDRSTIFDERAMLAQLVRVSLEATTVVAPLMILLTIIAVISPMVLGGWAFSMDSVTPKFERVSPLQGLKRMFSASSAMELFKSVLKVILVGAIAFGLVLAYRNKLIAIGGMPLLAAIEEAGSVLLLSFLALSCGLIVISAIDAPFQVWNFNKQQKMSMQEVKDESKEMNGKPEVKQRIRQLQMEFAQARQIDKVAEADVIITNPTHYAVALKYDQESMEAPILLAKGSDDFAQKIRAEAKKHKITIVRVPPLARALFYSTKVDTPIPGQLYLAVAQILAFVQQLRLARRAGVAPPLTPRPRLPKGFLEQYEGDKS